jgi:hypothetical protein
MAKTALDTSTIETESDTETSFPRQRKRKLTEKARELLSSPEDSEPEENHSAQQQRSPWTSPRSKNPVPEKRITNLIPVKSSTSSYPGVRSMANCSVSPSVHTASNSPSFTTKSRTNAARSIIQTTPTTSSVMSDEQQTNCSLESPNDSNVTTAQFKGNKIFS